VDDWISLLDDEDRGAFRQDVDDWMQRIQEAVEEMFRTRVPIDTAKLHEMVGVVEDVIRSWQVSVTLAADPEWRAQVESARSRWTGKVEPGEVMSAGGIAGRLRAT